MVHNEPLKPMGFKIPAKLHERLKIQSIKEHKEIQTILQELISEYLRKHESGNPAYQLTKWVDNADFIALPAFMESPQKWSNYVKQSSLKELQQIEGKALQIRELARKAWLAKSSIGNRGV